jgi:hypothetical protein
MVKPKKLKVVNAGNLVDYIMKFEGDNMTVAEMLSLFSYLIKTGQAWTLQGMYGRQAKALIDAKTISKTGVINWSKVGSPDEMIYAED